jgi:trehalose synthase
MLKPFGACHRKLSSKLKHANRGRRMRSLDDYREVVGDATVAEIHRRARRLQGRRVIHVNSTNEGGGVAEILNSLVILMNDVGIETDWRVLHGTLDFFSLTKEFHNGLQGKPVTIDKAKEQLYIQTNEAFAIYCNLDADCVIVHDPQPLPLIKFYKKREPWVWRCHIDLSNPQRNLWELLKTFVLRYDMTIVSSESYVKKDLPVEQRVICPAIDPLSPKNRDLSPKAVLRLLREAGIPTDKPVITQVSRMDHWKDPEGVLDVFQRVREKVDCRLLYCYSSSVDDPEGEEVLSRTCRKAESLAADGDVIFVRGNNQTLVNAIQRFSSVVMQKSIREGFCLCVTEALWKGTPVVGASIGGIPIQLREAKNGFLVDPHDTKGFADRVIQLLQDQDLARRMGRKGRETVRQGFLVTRLLLDYLDLLNDLLWRRKRRGGD